MFSYAHQEAFDASLPFFKGNLHCHSTVSDGRLDHGELIRRYKAQGYHFICFSDHDIFTDNTLLDAPDFITLPGLEWSSSFLNGQKTHHILGILGPAAKVAQAREKPLAHKEELPNPSYDGPKSAENMCRYLTERGYFTVYNHPRWSCVEPEEMGSLQGFTAMEVFNYGCDVENRTGDGDVYWDRLLNAGTRIWGVATDDNHNKKAKDDSFGGWICVNAPALEREAILSAILQGRFYASQGPAIENISIRDGRVHVKCPAVQRINFFAGGAIGLGCAVFSEDGENSLKEASYALKGKERYVRVECVTKDGKVAWSNPLYPENGITL